MILLKDARILYNSDSMQSTEFFENAKKMQFIKFIIYSFILYSFLYCIYTVYYIYINNKIYYIYNYITYIYIINTKVSTDNQFTKIGLKTIG